MSIIFTDDFESGTVKVLFCISLIIPESEAQFKPELPTVAISSI